MEPTAEEIELAACPIGLFRSTSGALCLKTGYVAPSGRVEAYIVSSGEFFWSGTRSAAEQRKVLVRPVDAAAILAMDRRAEVVGATVEDVEKIILAAEPYGDEDATWTRRMAVALHARLFASPPAPAVAAPDASEQPTGTWPPLKLALWGVITGEELNTPGRYVNAYHLTHKLFEAAMLAAAPEPPATLSEADIRNEGREDAARWIDHKAHEYATQAVEFAGSGLGYLADQSARQLRDLAAAIRALKEPRHEP